jgi:hypothetical protein
MVTRLAAWPWTGPVYPVVLVPEDRRSGVPGWRSQPAAGSVYPLVYANIAIRAPSQIRRWVAKVPAPLGRLAAAELAAEVEAACPPAAVREAVRSD